MWYLPLAREDRVGAEREPDLGDARGGNPGGQGRVPRGYRTREREAPAGRRPRAVSTQQTADLGAGGMVNEIHDRDHRELVPEVHVEPFFFRQQCELYV